MHFMRGYACVSMNAYGEQALRCNQSPSVINPPD